MRRSRDGAVGTVPSPQRVDIHKEKVSRREIGSLTISKRFPSYQKIMAPPSQPCLEPYYRKPLNFSILDDIGHGIKVSPGLRGCPPGVRGLAWAFSVPDVPSVAVMSARVGSNPSWMETRGLSLPHSPPGDSSRGGSVVPAWGGGEDGSIQQRETEAHNAQQKPSALLGPALHRDSLTPTAPFPAPKPPAQEGARGSGRGRQPHGPRRSHRRDRGEVAALGPRFPWWQAPLGRLRTAAPAPPSARGGPAETSGCCCPQRRGSTALWGAMSSWGGCSCPHPWRLRVSLCPQDHSTQLSRTGTLARKGTKSAAQAAGTLG